MRKAIAGALVVATAFACGGGTGGDGDGDSFDRRALLASAANEVIVPTVDALEAAASQLSSSVTAYCAALEMASEADALAAAQAAWRTTMELVQRTETMRLGPAAANDRELRDELYSWPLSSSCAVDQEVKTYFDDPSIYDISGRLTNRRGMDALEYVLFSTTLEHTCAGPVAPPGWDELSVTERKGARCGYAAAAAADVGDIAEVIATGWTEGGFAADFASAGLDGSSFDSAQLALNVLSDAMFFVEFEVKDIKIGEAAGITENSCAVVGAGCVEELESQFADANKANLIANMRAFEQLFVGGVSGGSGVGFDDMLVELGAPELAQTMTADIAKMIAAAEAIPGIMRDALASDYDSVAATHAAVKVVTDNLKSQFLTVLGLDIPNNSAGDND